MVAMLLAAPLSNENSENKLSANVMNLIFHENVLL